MYYDVPDSKRYFYSGDFISVAVNICYYDGESGYVEITEPRYLHTPIPKVIAREEFETIADGEKLAISLVESLENEAFENSPDPLENC